MWVICNSDSLSSKRLSDAIQIDSQIAVFSYLISCFTFHNLIKMILVKFFFLFSIFSMSLFAQDFSIRVEDLQDIKSYSSNISNINMVPIGRVNVYIENHGLLILGSYYYIDTDFLLIDSVINVVLLFF